MKKRMMVALAAAAMLVAPVLAIAASGPPRVSTSPADPTALTDTYALISGVVNPNGASTNYWFEWGPTASYGQTTPVTSASNGTADVPVDVSLDGLTAATTYHYRIAAQPASSTDPSTIVYGTDATFTTANALSVVFSGGRTAVKAGKALVTLTCDGGAEDTCAGRLHLSAKLKGKPRAVGSGGYSVDVGQKKTVAIRLSPAALRALRSASTHRLLAVVTSKPSGSKVTSSNKLVLATGPGARATAAATKTIIGSGSSVAEPYLRALIAGYHRIKPSLHFIYTSDGGNAGVKDVQQSRSQFAINTRPPLPSDSGTTYRQLALDGLCIDVNSSNALSNLSLGALADIYLARVTNWSQVSGSSLSTTIDPVGRDATAGTYTFFQQAVLNGKTQASNVNAVSSDGLVANAVAQDPNAIGYVGFSHSKGAHLKTLTLNGVACAPKYVKSQKYPLSRYIWFVTPSNGASKDVLKFAQWARTSVAAGKILKRAGAVPAFNRTH